MRYWRLKPDARLRPRVLCYFWVDPKADSGSRGEVPRRWQPQLLLPDGYSEVVFCVSGRFERRPLGEGRHAAVMSSSYLIGGRSHSVLTRNLSDIQLAGVKLDSRFLRSIIKTPLSEFRDATLALSDLDANRLRSLEDAVLNARSPAEMKHCLDLFFLQALRNLQPEEGMTSALRNRIQLSRGTLSIMKWARAAYVDARRMERTFCADMGMTPKQYARIVRFKQSYARLMLTGRKPGELKTHLDGYYDQSHFDREFRKFLGVAPRLKREDPMLPVTTVSDHLLEGELQSTGD